MLQLRPEQIAQMRKAKIGDGLIKTFDDTALRASRDAQTQDVLATDPNGHATRFSFDERGFIGAVTTPMGRTWSLANDPDGKARTLTNPAGHALSLVYTEAGSIDSIASDGRPRFKFQYDERRKLVQTGFADGTSSSIDYNPAGSIAATTDRRGARESYDYDPQGRLTSLADGNGNRTSFSYSVWNRPDRATHADGSSESYRYTDAGLLSEIRSADTSIKIEHDAEGLPIQFTYSDGSIVRCAYDSKGRILKASAGEHTSTFEWDEHGRLAGESSGNYRVDYRYDSAGQISGVTYPTGETVEFHWDPDARLSAVKDWNGGEHHLRYAPQDRGWGLASPNGLETLTLLNSKGLSESIAIASGPGASIGFAYDYDEEDRVRACNDSIAGARRYRYDAEGQLLGVDASDPKWGERFDYDPAGNLIEMSGATLRVNELNQLIADGSGAYEYDPCGNLVATGNWRFTYDARNLMVRAESSAGTVATYEYDAFRRRVIKSTGDATVTYVWAGDQLVSEVWQSGGRSAHRDYAYYPGTPTPLATRIGESVYCYHTDHLGTPFAMSGPDGELVWTAAYTAFGEARPSVAQVRNPLRAPGQYFDEETGLHYNRFRYYSPAIGRYLSRDPISYVAGLNLYQYSSNNPVNSADPLGLINWNAVISVAAAVAVGVAVVLLAPVAAATAIVLAGAAAGAVGFGLNEYLNEKTFCFWCVVKEAAIGACIGVLAATPFLFAPAAVGYAAFFAKGAASGAIGYFLSWATHDTPWSWGYFGLSIVAGAATAGLGKFIGGRFAAWRSSGAATTPKEIPVAGEEAQARAAQIRDTVSKRNWPRATSAAVDRTTGKVYHGDSGPPNPSPSEINPTLQSRMPDPSLEDWPVENCAEFKAVNNAANDGASIDDLDLHTVRVKDGTPFERCQNCQTTTDGAKVSSDPDPDSE